MLLCEWRQFIVVLLDLLLAISPETPVIYSIKFLVFNFLGAMFHVLESGYCCENQPVLVPVQFCNQLPKILGRDVGVECQGIVSNL